MGSRIALSRRPARDGAAICMTCFDPTEVGGEGKHPAAHTPDLFERVQFAVQRTG